MIVHPPTARSARNPGRRATQQRMRSKDAFRPLLRLYLRDKSESQQKGYFLNVSEVATKMVTVDEPNDNIILQPWLSVTDSQTRTNAIGIPVSICGPLFKHLMTCEEVGNDGLSESSEEIGAPCEQQNGVAHTTTPTQGSGDGHSRDGSSRLPQEPSAKQLSFHLERLRGLKIVCEATGCLLEIVSKNPVPPTPDENREKQADAAPAPTTRRWLVSTPANPKVCLSGITESPDADSADEADKRVRPWERQGAIELHESLMGQFCLFLADVATRYQSFDDVPEVPSLYSASGGRRFFFDLRDTPWGKRIHISQVTEQHRNVIGIPLEEVVNFRNRLDTIIRKLGLDDEYDIRSKVNIQSSNVLRMRRRPPNARVRSTNGTTLQSTDQQGPRDANRRRRNTGNRRFIIDNAGGDSGVPGAGKDGSATAAPTRAGDKQTGGSRPRRSRNYRLSRKQNERKNGDNVGADSPGEKTADTKQTDVNGASSSPESVEQSINTALPQQGQPVAQATA